MLELGMCWDSVEYNNQIMGPVCEEEEEKK